MQPNCIVTNNAAPILYAGFEDNFIKSFDIRTGNLK